MYSHAAYASTLLALAALSASCARGGKDAFSYAVSRTAYEDVVTVDGVVEPIRSATLYCPANVEGTVTFLVEDGTLVEEGEVVCVIEAQALQNEYDRQMLDLENAKANLSKAQADQNLQYALLEAQVNNSEADMKIAQLDSLQLAYATPTQRRIKALELQRAAIEKAKYGKKLQALAIIQQSEVKMNEQSIKRIENRLQSLGERIAALTIKAPQSGLALRPIYRVTGTGKVQVGDIVWGNIPLLTIPEVAQMKVKMMVAETDYKHISVGDSVSYAFDAMPGNVAWGKVLMKSPVGQPIKKNSKVKLFEVEASIDSAAKLPDPGFTASCRVTLAEVRDTIVIPQVAIFEEDLMKFVYVKQRSGYEMRQIQTGLSSRKEAIVAAGLQDSDVISLVKPAPHKVKRKALLPDSTVAK
ncbi:MAG: hypothetical protein LBF55_07730 [Prevotellaceae bacterium]|jgi:multidrug efflux pump subunit AcrA (membrane-fusion protein)|nr:hypothetical protein [Prevotellaceae bacterium]